MSPALTPAVYLTAVVLLGFAATLLRLPPLVGFLAAGFVLGACDVEHLGYVEVLGDLGVAVLLFTIGLKLDLRVLARRRSLARRWPPRSSWAWRPRRSWAAWWPAA